VLAPRRGWRAGVMSTRRIGRSSVSHVVSSPDGRPHDAQRSWCGSSSPRLKHTQKCSSLHPRRRTRRSERPPPALGLWSPVGCAEGGRRDAAEQGRRCTGSIGRATPDGLPEDFRTTSRRLPPLSPEGAYGCNPARQVPEPDPHNLWTGVRVACYKPDRRTQLCNATRRSTPSP
jgi:hypothetical protein